MHSPREAAGNELSAFIMFAPHDHGDVLPQLRARRFLPPGMSTTDGQSIPTQNRVRDAHTVELMRKWPMERVGCQNAGVR